MNEIYKESIVEDDLHIHRAMKKIKAMVGKDRNPLDVAKDWIDEVPHLVAVGIEISEIQELEQNVAKYGSIENWLSAERTKENTSTRKLDDDAREVVERLRGIGTSLMENGACCWTEIVNALGTNSCDDPTLLSTWDNDMTLTRERLIELIERPIHDVDVAALLELADEMEGIAVPPEGDYERGFYDAWCRAHKRILKAVKGAPKPDTEREAEAGEPNRLAHLNLAELAAAEWVEDHGGLDVVRDLAKMDEFVAALAIDLGVSDDVGCGDELRAAIKAELDKRLMPCDLTWPRWDDGCPVTRDDSPNDAVGVLLALDGSYYSLFDSPDFAVDPIEQRVKRPEPDLSKGEMEREADGRFPVRTHIVGRPLRSIAVRRIGEGSYAVRGEVPPWRREQGMHIRRSRRWDVLPASRLGW